MRSGGSFGQLAFDLKETAKAFDPQLVYGAAANSTSGPTD
jgi:hypothetical protein